MNELSESHPQPANQRIICRDQHLTLLPQRALFWEEKRYLLLADLHLGKAGHFRKHGSPIPAAVHWKDLVVLGTLIERYRPESVVMLGDLFHSSLNNEWLDFARWMEQYRPLSFVLVKGNHDRLPEAAYALEQLRVVADWRVDPFLFTHQPRQEPHPQRGGWTFPKAPEPPDELYNLAGHIHPGVNVPLGIGQSTRLPCFFFGPQQGLLPAFGQFTGRVRMRVVPGDRVFGIIKDHKVIRLS